MHGPLWGRRPACRITALVGLMQAESPWQIWIDTGGTFTDCIAVDPAGAMHRCKVLSSGALRDRVAAVEDDGLRLTGGALLPDGFLTGMELSLLGEESGVKILEHNLAQGLVRLAGPVPGGIQPGAPVELRSGEEAPLLAARLITGTPFDGSLPPVAMRLATTRGTNALLERGGARTAHFITAGFEDLLMIGGQQRPDLFALHIERPEPLSELVVGVKERLAADGSVVEDLDRKDLVRAIAELRERGIGCASITLLHGHRNPVHEELLEQMLVDAAPLRDLHRRRLPRARYHRLSARGRAGSGRRRVGPARHDLGRRTGRRRRLPVDG